MLIYTNIQHWPRKYLQISVLEYCFCDMVYHLCNNQKYWWWCIMSRPVLAEELWITKQAILNIIDKMIKIWIIQKDDDTKYIKTTQLRYDVTITNKDKYPTETRGKESLPQPVKKVYPPSKESLPNNNIYKYINKENIYIYIYIQKNIKSIYHKYINTDVNMNSLLIGILSYIKDKTTKVYTKQETEERYSVKKHMDKWLTIWRGNSLRVKDSCWRIIPQPRKINDNIVKLFIVKSKRYTDEEFEYAVKVYWETVCAPWYKYKPLWFDDFLARKEWWLEKYVNKVLEEKQEKGVMESFMTDFIKHDSM